MVCLDEGSTVCIVRDTMPESSQGKISIVVRPSYLVHELITDVGNQFQYEEFELLLQASKDSNHIILNDVKDRTLKAAGLNFDEGSRNRLIIGPLRSQTRRKQAMIDTTPIEQQFATNDNTIIGIPNPPPLPIMDTVDSTSYRYNSPIKLYSPAQPVIGYRGLVNQAMTCYLNSLLQALFMTPEFRNALYKWEFDGDGESKSIPYQLQKLFLNMQTSPKSAVETTDLTKSFGWDYTEAWQQHDIQELCRVMFDALEVKFKNTKQADLINTLYEGKMTDYVTCLDCGIEKSREDVFLDIPLPIRPFGSTVSYGSVEEALRGFIQPETLDGNNQYFCEKCDKNCDAHKGLKFTKFPYILTLHLKRFDFNYQTLQRNKLNVKVTFPQNLNLNGLINNVNTKHFGPQETNGGTSASSENGSDSALGGEDFNGVSHSNGNGLQAEDDEGIDMTSADCRVTPSSEPGPYNYELFAIMIHSGSASGGHYYAYIRDFETGDWFCFNDDKVTSITQEDIQKSFGGGTCGAYYTSSTNAYMMMYRQVDSVKNCSAIKLEEFPEHIKELLQKLKDKEENDKKNRELEAEFLKIKVHFFDPKKQRMTDTKVYMSGDSTLAETLEDAYNRVAKNFAPLERCRLVGYDSAIDNCEISFEGKEKTEINEILNSLRSHTELLLEIREEGTEFEVYEAGGILTKVFTVDLTTSDIDGPVNIRAMEHGTVLDYKKLIASKMGFDIETIVLAIRKYSTDEKILDSDHSTLSSEQITAGTKVFVTIAGKGEDVSSKFKKIIGRFEHIITLHFTLPNTDAETLDKLSIPMYEPTEIIENITNGTTSVNNSSLHSDGECNSEDSSLSDGDRTLVESLTDGHIPSTNNSPACSDLQLSSPEETTRKINDYCVDDDAEFKHVVNRINYYFKATFYDEMNCGDEVEKTKVLKVLVDNSMIVGGLKRSIEPLIKVPSEYFKIMKISNDGKYADSECARLTETLKSFKDGERLAIELGRALRKGESKCKVYFLKLSEVTDETEKFPFLCEWIIKTGANVGEVKQELLTHIATLDPKYEIAYEKCRLRKKNWKNPSKVYLDDQTFGDDVSLSNNGCEIFLQEVEDCSQPVVSSDELVLFVKQWNPSTLTLGPFQEIALEKNVEMRQLISELSGIPLDNVEYAKLNGSFPRTLSVLQVHNNLTWSATSTTVDKWPLNIAYDGNIFYYRNSEEQLKELTSEERRELTGKENTRMEKLGCSTATTYSHRRERALKIYLDSPPKKRDD